MLQQQQNLGRSFGTIKIHLSHPVALAAVRSKAGSVVVDSLLIVTPIVGFSDCSMFCCALRGQTYDHSLSNLSCHPV